MTELENRLGVSVVATIIAEDLRWLFREQLVSDQGIDAHVETAVDGHGTGRLLALQIKSGSSWFRRRASDGWWFSFSERENRLWLGHALPVMVVLVDTEAKEAYWQRIVPSTVVPTGKHYKVLVPRGQTLATAGRDWDHIASGLETRAVDRYELNLGYLPPSARVLLAKYPEEARWDAAVLAMHLAEGRTNPVGTLQGLLATRPGWLTRHHDRGWRVLGAYAAEHTSLRESADAFIEAAATSTDDAARLLAAAALNVHPVSAEESRTLLEQADALGGAGLLVAVGRVVLEHPPGDASPFRLPSVLLEDGEEVERSEAAQRLLADHALRRRDVTTAARHAERALELAPENTDSMAQLAHVYLVRGNSAERQADDLRRSADLYQAAIKQRRAWSGPTHELLRALAPPLALQGRLGEMLRWFLPAPEGTAATDEAADPVLLRHALVAAALVGRTDLLDPISAEMGDSTADQVARHRAGLLRLGRNETIELWHKEVTRAEAEEDCEALAQAVTSLAALGVDAADRLQGCVEAGIVPATMRDVARALAAAKTDFDRGLPELRSVARSDASAAEYLIQGLAGHGRREEAIQACRAAHDRFRMPYFLIERARLLIAAHDDSRAETAAAEAVAVTREFPDERRQLSSFLAHRAGQRGDWTTAETIMAAAVQETDTPHPDATWNLVTAQLLGGNGSRAAGTVRRYRPEIRDSDDATRWLQAMVSVDWDESIVSEALALATQFADHPGLAVALLGHVITGTSSPDEDDDQGEGDTAEEAEDGLEDEVVGTAVSEAGASAVPGELHRRAFQILHELVERHGDATGVTVLQGETEELVEQMAAMLRERDDRPLRDVLDMVMRARAPVGLLATSIGRSYAAALVQRSVGSLVGSAADYDEHDREIAAARSVLGGEVVIDASALLVTSQISAPLGGIFTAVALPPESRRDIMRASIDIKTLARSPGTLGWDPRRQAPVFYERTPAEHEWMLHRMTAMEQEASHAVVRGVEDPSLFADLDDRDAPWLTPIELAAQENLVLWSDDLAQRRLARGSGVDSFGTMALMDCLTEDRLAAAGDEVDDSAIEALHRTVQEMVAECVVDVPAHLADLLRQAESDDWEPRAAGLVISRPAWWFWQTDAVSDLWRLYQAVAEHRTDVLPDWQYAAMLGLGRAQGGPTEVAQVLAVLALLGFEDDPIVDDLLEGCRRAREMAEHLGAPDPARQLPLARERLVVAEQPRSPQLVEQLVHLLATDGPTTPNAPSRSPLDDMPTTDSDGPRSGPDPA